MIVAATGLSAAPVQGAYINEVGGRLLVFVPVALIDNVPLSVHAQDPALGGPDFEPMVLLA